MKKKPKLKQSKSVLKKTPAQTAQSQSPTPAKKKPGKGKKK